MEWIGNFLNHRKGMRFAFSDTCEYFNQLKKPLKEVFRVKLRQLFEFLRFSLLGRFNDLLSLFLLLFILSPLFLFLSSPSFLFLINIVSGFFHDLTFFSWWRLLSNLSRLRRCCFGRRGLSWCSFSQCTTFWSWLSWRFLSLFFLLLWWFFNFIQQYIVLVDKLWKVITIIVSILVTLPDVCAPVNTFKSLHNLDVSIEFLEDDVECLSEK